MHLITSVSVVPMPTDNVKNSSTLDNKNQQKKKEQEAKSLTTINNSIDMIRNKSNHDNASASATEKTNTTVASHSRPMGFVSSEASNGAPMEANNSLEDAFQKQNHTNYQEHTMHHGVNTTGMSSTIPSALLSHFRSPQQVIGGSASNDVPTYSGNGQGFTPPPIVERNFGAASSKDDGVSDYSDASLNGERDSRQEEEMADFDHHEDDEDYDEDVDDDEDDDDQPVKLFIGQVPKQMEEPDLFAIFEKYGPMDDVAIIRDKHTGQHRGCAFVTFLQKESAELCEKELHGTFVFEGGKRPVQVRPAGWKEENKIFVGMLPKDVTEEMVFKVFEPYGEIMGVFVIQSTDGYRKGCAFVKFVNRMDAHKAIEELHNKVVFENSDRPLIVKIADSKKEKNKMSLHNPGSKQGRYSSSRNSSGHGGSTTNLVYSDAGGVSNTSQMNPLSQDVYYISSLHGPLGIAHPGSHQQQAHAHLPPHHPIYPGHLHGIEHMGHVALPVEHALNHNHETSLDHFNPIFPSHAFPVAYMEHGYDHSNQQHPSRHPHPHPQPYLSPQQQMALHSNARPREGPAGANLFIYHLPHDLTDADLATAFNPFGNVISAKVFVDKVTGESKGFGFVSYDSVISAEQAIELMNGFQIGNKRLKVQHKRIHHHPRHAQMGVPMSSAGAVLGPGVGVGGLPNQMHHHHHSPYMYPYSISALGQQHVSAEELSNMGVQHLTSQQGYGRKEEGEDTMHMEAAMGTNQTNVQDIGGGHGKVTHSDSNIHSTQGSNETQVPPGISQTIVDDLTQQFHNRLRS